MLNWLFLKQLSQCFLLWTLLFFSPLYAEECVWCQCNHIWGNYVFRGQRASSGKAIYFLFSFFLRNSWVREIKVIITRYCCFCLSEYYWTVHWCLLFPPAAPGYENLCGHRLRHSAGPPTPQGHHRARARHWRRHQAIQQVCEASLRAVHWANHETGWYCCAKRWDSWTSLLFGIVITEYTTKISNCTALFMLFSSRWWQYGGHWSDRPARSQPAGGGDDTLEGGATMCQETATHSQTERETLNCLYMISNKNEIWASQLPSFRLLPLWVKQWVWCCSIFLVLSKKQKLIFCVIELHCSSTDMFLHYYE